jgi:hypothetical protein
MPNRNFFVVCTFNNSFQLLPLRDLLTLNKTKIERNLLDKHCSNPAKSMKARRLDDFFLLCYRISDF